MITWEEIAFFILYYIAGLILSAVYVLLAGWSLEHWFFLAFFAPIVFLLLMLLGILSGVIQIERLGVYRHRSSAFSPVPFWVVLGYLSLPIILNGVAKLLNLIGYNDIGDFLFEHRYVILPIVFLAVVAVLFIFSAAAAAKERFQKRFSKSKT